MDNRRFLIVLLTCLLILPCLKDANSADWTWFDKGSNNLSFFYDAESTNLLPDNIIRVWVKAIPETEEDRVRHIQSERKAGFAISDYWGSSIGLFEINCKNKKSACVQETSYSIKGESIKLNSVKHPYLNHQYITAETTMEELYKNLCVKKDLKKKSR